MSAENVNAEQIINVFTENDVHSRELLKISDITKVANPRLVCASLKELDTRKVYRNKNYKISVMLDRMELRPKLLCISPLHIAKDYNTYDNL